MTEFEDFLPFFEAMIAKMKEKDEAKGDSWKEDFWTDDVGRGAFEIINVRRPVSVLLQDGLKRETREYFESLDPSELLDIGNFCAMLYMRSSEVKSE